MMVFCGDLQEDPIMRHNDNAYVYEYTIHIILVHTWYMYYIVVVDIVMVF